MTCQIVRGTMERVKQRDREGRRCLLLMETVGKVLMSDTPCSIMHRKFGSGLPGHLEEEFLCKAQELEWIV